MHIHPPAGVSFFGFLLNVMQTVCSCSHVAAVLLACVRRPAALLLLKVSSSECHALIR